MNLSDDDYFILDPKFTDPSRMRKEREKARKLKRSQWWLTLRNRGICHYCGKKFSPRDLTMDHIVPLARGGTTSPGNVVPACRGCNSSKRLKTPVDEILRNRQS